MHSVRYEELRPAELTAARDQTSVVFLPIGSLEYHGFHLPLGLDTQNAYAVCLEAARQGGGVHAAAHLWGTQGHEGFTGSLLLKVDTIQALVTDAIEALAAQGYRLIVVCTGHYPAVQGALISAVAERFNAAGPVAKCVVVDPFSLCRDDPEADHAGIRETSAMLFLRPELVAMGELTRPGALHAISASCVGATAELGRARSEAAVAELIRTVGEALARGMQPPDEGAQLKDEAPSFLRTQV